MQWPALMMLLVFQPDPDVMLKLGNAHVLAGELPEAILAYRRGLQEHPLHPQLWENLEATRDMVGYSGNSPTHRPTGDDWPLWLPRPAPDSLLHATLWLHAAAWLAVGGWLVSRRRAAAGIAILFFVMAGVGASWWGFLEYRITQDRQRPLAVVAHNGVTVRRGNGTLYPRHADLPLVNRGMEARVLHERGGWVQVAFPGGVIGWLPRGAVLVSTDGHLD